MDQTCLKCGTKNEASTRLDGNFAGPGPTAGALSICFYCGAWAMFAADLSLRELTAAELAEIASRPELVATLAKFEKHRRRSRARLN